MELFGVSVTTLEEVFLRVGRDHTEADVAADERLQQVGLVRGGWCGRVGWVSRRTGEVA